MEKITELRIPVNWDKGTTATITIQADRRDRYEKKKWLSIFLVVCLIGGIGGGIWYRQKRIDERRLSLVYIPKVVDKTNDFWKDDPGTRMAAQEYNAAIEIKARQKKMMWNDRMNY